MAVSLPRQNYDIISREQNGRTSFEYDGISSKSETLKRSLAKDDSASEEQGMKDKNESDNEPDGEPAAKMRRGGGRRKQSKPMRMFADVETASDSDPSRQILDQLPLESAASDGKRATMFSAAFLPFVCELCHENFQSNGALKEHVYQVHTMVLGDEPVKDSVCPTKYHVLGKELKQETSFETATKAEGKEVTGFSENSDSAAADEDSNGRCDWMSVSKEEDAANSEDDLLKSGEHGHNAACKAQADQFHGKMFACGDESQTSSSISHGSKVEKPCGNSTGKQSVEFGASVTTFDPAGQNDLQTSAASSSSAATASLDPAKSRIFHPDAYCEICDREFCNKYFLKTHKANKHGIYDNMTGLESSASGNSDLFYGILQQQHQQPCSATPPKASPPKSCGDLSNGLHTMSMLPNSGVSNVADESSSIPTIKLSSTEADDCCDICQKHFASKHQLKKHKQECHGFLSQADKRSSVTGLPVGSPNSTSLSASMDNTSVSHSLLMPHLATTANSVPSALPDFSRMASLSNLMFLNPFNSPLAVIPPLFPSPGLGFRPSSLAIPQLPLQDVQKTVSASRFTSDSSSLPGNLLQSMGVLNAEALMELYRKEFCNSYLMRSQEASGGRSGLFSGGMTGFQSGMPTGMNFSLPVKTGNQDGGISNEPLLLKQDKHDMDGVGGGGEVCEICKKTFISKSSLVSHLLTVHNVKQESCDLASELMKLDKLSEDHHFEKAMFGNMVAAKLVDRVQCDICNKEVCNKYFLKTHKIKVHGWDPASGERDVQEKNLSKQTSPVQPQNLVQEPPAVEMASLEKPKEEELLQMGIDPEAYCEICKKEFCNKYFLKTHKQNIHGIKTAGNLLENRSNPAETWSFSQALSQTNPLPTAQLSLYAGTQQLQPLVPTLNPPSLMSVLESGVPDGNSEKRSWKWKEPVNAMRVTCEICNKVLCNKYFLKTHMMKRHGVNYDTITGQLMNTIKCNPDYGLSRGGEESHSGNEELPTSQVMLMQNADKQVPNSRGIMRHGSGVFEQNLNLMEKSVESENEGSIVGARKTINPQSEVDRCVGTSLRNDAESRVPSAMNLVLSETSRALDLTSSANMVMAKTWRVPSEGHDVDDDHRTSNESLISETDQEATDDIFIHRVSEDDAGDRDESKFHSTSVMLDEIRGSSEGGSPMSSGVDEKKYQSAAEFSASDISKRESASVETAKTAIANHIRSQHKKRMFRCPHCRERFQSLSHCELHIRTCHPRLEGAAAVVGHQVDIGPDVTGKKPLNTTNEASASTNPLGYLNGYAQVKPLIFSNECDERKDNVVTSDVLSKQQQPVIYAQPIDQTNLSNILMQPFLLKEVGGENHFAASLVYLPALQKINEPLSVTFSLTPILQH